MVKVKIINGVYGYKPKGVQNVRTVRFGGVVEVTKAEARRLQDLDVAALLEDEKAQPPEDTANGEPDSIVPPGADAADDPVI